MVAAISPINSAYRNIDPEYMRILNDLRRLGLSPSGNKEVDKTRLEQGKEELIDKIKHKENSDNSSSLGVQVISPTEDVDYVQRAEMEEQRLGAMTVAELNRLYFGI